MPRLYDTRPRTYALPTTNMKHYLTSCMCWLGIGILLALLFACQEALPMPRPSLDPNSSTPPTVTATAPSVTGTSPATPTMANHTPMPAPPLAPYRDANLPVETRVQDLLERMTLEEKIGQM